MYQLIFKKNRSKHFENALSFANEIGCTIEEPFVKVNIKEENLLWAYSSIRTLFGIIQNWKDTHAYFRGKEVHPYQFILYMHRIGECADKSGVDIENCNLPNGVIAWSCKHINLISYELKGSGNYQSNRKYWYNYGEFSTNGNWVINKLLIKKMLLGYVENKGIDACPFYDETKMLMAIENLPNYIIPDDVTFKIHYSEEYSNGQIMRVPINIRHVTEKICNLNTSLPSKKVHL